MAPNPAFEIAQARPSRRRSHSSNQRRYSRYAPRLLSFFVRHRVALADQVQREFVDSIGGDRNTRLHLQTLVAHGDLSRRRQEGIGRPNVYQITSRGLRRVTAASGVVIHPRRVGMTSHVAHDLLITEVAVLVGERMRADASLSRPWQARFELSGHAAFAGLLPDYAFMFAHPKGKLVCFVEVSSGEESSTRLGQKLDQYARWSSSEGGRDFLLDLYAKQGATEPRAVFRLLFVVQNRRTGNDATRLAALVPHIMRQPSPMQRRVWATTVAAIAQAGSIDAPVWLKGDELVAALPKWDTLTAIQRRRLVADKLPDLMHHRLFPEDNEP